MRPQTPTMDLSIRRDEERLPRSVEAIGAGRPLVSQPTDEPPAFAFALSDQRGQRVERQVTSRFDNNRHLTTRGILRRPERTALKEPRITRITRIKDKRFNSLGAWQACAQRACASYYLIFLSVLSVSSVVENLSCRGNICGDSLKIALLGR